jgi:endonuclease YncB( thermonuclease family)
VRRLAPLLLILVLGVACSDGTPTPSSGEATVERVVDGDTLRIRLGPSSERVRLIGIDAPESVKPDTPVQCFAREASDHLAQLLPRGVAVRLEGDVESRDRYGRLLAYVHRARDGLFVNLAQVRDGFAVPYTVPPNVARADELVAASRQAREAGRGLWRRCSANEIPRQ